MSVSEGATVTCITCQGDTLSGSVIAWDKKTKACIISILSENFCVFILSVFTSYSLKFVSVENSKGSLHVINLHHVTELNVTGHVQNLTTPTNLRNINVSKVRQRLEKNVEAVWRKVESRGVNVSEEAQLLFDSLIKV